MVFQCIFILQRLFVELLLTAILIWQLLKKKTIFSNFFQIIFSGMVLALSKGPEHPKKLVFFFLNLKKQKTKPKNTFIFFIFFYLIFFCQSKIFSGSAAAARPQISRACCTACVPVIKYAVHRITRVYAMIEKISIDYTSKYHVNKPLKIRERNSVIVMVEKLLITWHSTVSTIII